MEMKTSTLESKESSPRKETYACSKSMLFQKIREASFLGEPFVASSQALCLSFAKCRKMVCPLAGDSCSSSLSSY